MKKLFATLIFIALFQYLQAQNCSNPISQTTFQAGFNQVAVMPNNDTKLVKAMGLLTNSCLMSENIKSMSQLFTDDAFRLEYCKAAYSHSFDRANYYQVYDGFTKFSSAFMLHDYILTVNGGATPVVVSNPVVTTPLPPAAGVVFPIRVYPPHTNYNGKKGCAGPVISDEQFKAAVMNVNSQPTDESKFLAIQNASDQYCLSFTMMMKFSSMLQQEGLRSKIMMNTFAKTFDQGNYEFGKVLFSTEGAKNEWVLFAKNYLTPPPPPCLVSGSAFTALIKDFEEQRFTDDKMKMFNNVSKDRCFNVEQVRAISKQFPFDDEKMIVIKNSYAKCTDRPNYYKLVDEVTFSANKDNLRNYISSH